MPSVSDSGRTSFSSHQRETFARVEASALPVTSTLVSAPLLRITVQPGLESGLQKPSQVMVDKAMTVKRDRVGPAFGRLDANAMVEVERCLAVFLGIAK